MSKIDEFQVRFNFVDSNGRLTPEASSFLQGWFRRLGGANGLDTQEAALLNGFSSDTARADALAKSLEQLEIIAALSERPALAPDESPQFDGNAAALAELSKRVDDLQLRMAVIPDPSAALAAVRQYGEDLAISYWFVDPTFTDWEHPGAIGAKTANTGAFTALTATTLNKVTVTAPATAATLTLANNSTLSTVGAFTTTFTITGNTGVTFPTSGTLATLAGAEALTNKTYEGNTWTAGTGTLTIAAGKVATFNQTMTFTGTSGTTMTFPATSATIARTDAANSFSGNQSMLALLDLSGASAGQVKFPATQNASADANTLDDYEEGTWTPAYAFGGGGSCTYTTQVGTYTKIGRLVTIQARIAVNTISAPLGALQITGLPFASRSGDNGAAAIFGTGLAATAATSMVGYVESGATTMLIRHFAAGATSHAGPDIAAGCTMYVTATYEV